MIVNKVNSFKFSPNKIKIKQSGTNFIRNTFMILKRVIATYRE